MPDTPAKGEKLTQGTEPSFEIPNPGRSILIQEQHSGPLPSPRVMNAYRELGEDFPERIFAMAEKEQAHRHEIANRNSRTASFAQKAGVVLAGLLALVGVLGGVALVFADKNAQGFVTILLALGTLIGTAAYRQRVGNTNS